LVYYILVILLVPFLAGQILVFCDYLRLDDGIVKIDQIWDSIVPYWINWFVDIVPDSIWLAMPGRLINTIFVSDINTSETVTNHVLNFTNQIPVLRLVNAVDSQNL
jgi:hypothetical protein